MMDTNLVHCMFLVALVMGINEGSHICKKCGKSFNEYSALVFHSLEHETELPDLRDLVENIWSEQNNLLQIEITLGSDMDATADFSGNSFNLCLEPLVQSTSTSSMALSPRDVPSEARGEKPKAGLRSQSDLHQCNSYFTHGNNNWCLESSSQIEPSSSMVRGMYLQQETCVADFMSTDNFGLTNNDGKKHIGENINDLHKNSLTGSAENSFSCDRKFSSNSERKLHTSSDIGENPHSSDTSDRNFTASECPKQRKLTHTGEKPYHCETCGKCLSSERNLKNHYLSHSGEKPHRCEICGRCFSIKRCLKRHYLTHSGEKPHQCEKCGKKFSSKSSLKQHDFTHSGEKPHQCEKCGKKFSSKWNLKQHDFTHGGEKPHKCNTCGNRFLTQFKLLKHLRTHKREKKYL